MEFTQKKVICCLVAGLVMVSLLEIAYSHTSQPRYYRSTAEDGVERVVEIVPSSVTVRPRPRQRISSAFAKQYWTSGNFFNRDNFGAQNDAGDDNGVLASGSAPRPLIFRAKMVPVITEEIFQEL